MDATTLGPIESSVRDAVADYRDSRSDLNNYNETIKALLEEADA